MRDGKAELVVSSGLLSVKVSPVDCEERMNLTFSILNSSFLSSSLDFLNVVESSKDRLMRLQS